MLVVSGFLVFSSTTVAKGEEYKSKFVTVKCNKPGDLDKFTEKLQPGALTRTLNKVFLGKGRTSENSGLGEFLDSLLQRVQLILDMRMPELAVTIQILQDQKEVSAAYARVSGISSDAFAFYDYKTNTIYVQIEHTSIGIVAQEMGHAIIDHYFAIQPPPKIAEMLCQYVDKEISGGNF